MQAPQVNRLFSKSICKPDAVEPGETGEMEPTERKVICPAGGLGFFLDRPRTCARGT